MRVVLLTTGLARGGAETQVVQLAAGLRAAGDEVTVISLAEPGRESVAAGVPVCSLRMRPGRANPLGMVRLVRLLRRLRPHVLHAHMFHANLMARLAGVVCPVPVISTLHSLAESPRHSSDMRRRDLAYRLTDTLSTVTVAVSRAVAERHAQAKAVSRRRLRVVYNCVDTSRFRPDADVRARVRAEMGLGDGFVWLAAGRLMWKKDYPTLLRAFAELVPGPGEPGDRTVASQAAPAQRHHAPTAPSGRGSDPETTLRSLLEVGRTPGSSADALVGPMAVRRDAPGATGGSRADEGVRPTCLLLIAGEGPQEAALRATAPAGVRFLGARDDIPELMQAADGFVLSSVVEGLPLALLEAAASALICVATDAGGVREVLPARFLVAPGDAAALAGAMRAVMQMPAGERGRIGEEMRSLAVAGHDITAAVRRWRSLYCEIAWPDGTTGPV